ncbi:hypothetical protein NMY22_g493 [Coprinellus aureogranulatus]|nr:hypothetical protein NMY22_g493 [Coprinellus aureogranulatus]
MAKVEPMKAEVYHVESVEGAQRVGEIYHYHIKWLSYPENENTWVSSANCLCLGAIDAFWRVAEVQPDGTFAVAKEHRKEYEAYKRRVRKALAGTNKGPIAFNAGDGDDDDDSIPPECLWLTPEQLGVQNPDRDTCFTILCSSLKAVAKDDQGNIGGHALMSRLKKDLREPEGWSMMKCGISERKSEDPGRTSCPTCRGYVVPVNKRWVLFNESDRKQQRKAASKERRRTMRQTPKGKALEKSKRKLKMQTRKMSAGGASVENPPAMNASSLHDPI